MRSTLGIHQVVLCLLFLFLSSVLSSIHIHHNITSGHSLDSPILYLDPPSHWPLNEHFHSFRFFLHSLLFLLLLLILLFRVFFHSAKVHRHNLKSREKRTRAILRTNDDIFCFFSNNKWYQSSKNNKNRHQRRMTIIHIEEEKKKSC